METAGLTDRSIFRIWETALLKWQVEAMFQHHCHLKNVHTWPSTLTGVRGVNGVILVRKSALSTY